MEGQKMQRDPSVLSQGAVFIPIFQNKSGQSPILRGGSTWRTLVKGHELSSVAQLCPILWDPLNCSTPGFPIHHQLPELAQTHVHRIGDAIQPCHPLSSPFPPALNLSQHQGLSRRVSFLHIRWPKNWSYSFSISPSSEYSGLISFRIDWLDLLAVQGTLKSILQHQSSKASILQHWKPVSCMCFPCAPTYLPVKEHVSDTWVADELPFSFLN